MCFRKYPPSAGHKSVRAARLRDSGGALAWDRCFKHVDARPKAFAN
jgi:hypothetical protein